MSLKGCAAVAHTTVGGVACAAAAHGASSSSERRAMGTKGRVALQSVDVEELMSGGSGTH